MKFSSRTTTNILLAASITLLSLNAVLLLTNGAKNTPTRGAHFETTKISERAVGTDVALTVHTLREDLVGAGPLTPPQGMKFVVADLTVENISTSSIQIIPLLNFYLKDEAGHVYRNSAVISSHEMLSGEILPGDKLREEIGFAVPKDDQRWWLYYEPGMAGAQTFVVELNN